PSSPPSGGSASFTYTYAPLLACANGTIEARVTDGWQTTALTPPGTVNPTQQPVGAIYSPSVETKLLQYDAIVGSGNAFGAGSGSVAIQWYLTGPTGSGYSNTLVGTGPSFVLQPPLPGGWVPGAYTLTE